MEIPNIIVRFIGHLCDVGLIFSLWLRIQLMISLEIGKPAYQVVGGGLPSNKNSAKSLNKAQVVWYQSYIY